MAALCKVFVLVVVASLAGCASTSNTARMGQGNFADADYMYAVESIARHKGVDVVWINPPDEEGRDFSKAARH